MPAYVEMLPSDRVTHMLGRPIERLVTDTGDLGNMGFFKKKSSRKRKGMVQPSPAATPQAAAVAPAPASWQQFAYQGPSFAPPAQARPADPFSGPGFNPYSSQQVSQPAPYAPQPAYQPAAASYGPAGDAFEYGDGGYGAIDDFAGPSTFVEADDVAALGDLGCGGMIGQVADEGLGCSGQIGGGIGFTADDGALSDSGDAALRRAFMTPARDRAALGVRELALGERALIESDKAVQSAAKDALSRRRDAKKRCRERLKACQSRLREAGLSGSTGHGELANELRRLAALDRALEADERRVLEQASERLAAIRSRLAKFKGALASRKRAGADVESARLRAKLEACNKRWTDHMREEHGQRD